jgi:hypothetical protein
MTGFWGGNKTTIIELEKGSRLPELTGDLRESLRTLDYHPGFQYLLQRLRVAKAGILSQLQEGLSLTEVQLRYLQAGLYWAGWLENEHLSLSTKRPPSRPTTEDEEAEFRAIRENLELVGTE